MPPVTVFVTRDSHAFRSVTQRVSHGTPSRPVPTRPIYNPYRALRGGVDRCKFSLQTNLCNERERLA